MSICAKNRIYLAASVMALVLGAGAPAYAADAATLQALQDQITSLQKQLAQLQAAQVKTEKEAAAARRAAAAAPAPAPVPAATPAAATTTASAVDTSSLKGIIKAKTGVDMTLGGFVDMTMALRDKNQAADTGSNFNTMIPFNNAVNAHQNEFRGSARSTRLSLLATGNASTDTKLTAFVETDFAAAGSTSTQTQTNSYLPRIRQAFAAYEDSEYGLHLAAGQMWTMVAMNSMGIDPLKATFPMVVDAGFMVGVNYARTPQVRLVKDFDDKKGWVGLSVESPAAAAGGICTSSTVFGNSPSTSTDACSGFDPNIRVSATAYSGNMQGSVTTDVAPDIVAKVAYDPGWGHYELFGVTRFFHGTSGSAAHNNYAMGAGVGAGAIVPVIQKKLDLQANIAVGKGIARYGTTQLPDFSLTSTGKIKPLEQYTALFGVVGRPTPAWDLYLYGGLEQTFRHGESGGNNAYGYGNFGIDNSNCNTTGDTTGCYAQTSSVWEVTPGFWHRFYDGNYGKMQVGVQYSWTRRNAFSDQNGINPHGIENITMFSLRYSPF